SLGAGDLSFSFGSAADTPVIGDWNGDSVDDVGVRTNPAALTVSYTVSGTAAAGTDYQSLPGTVTIPAGSASATITVNPIDDAAPEPTESVVVTLAAGASYTVGSPSSATVSIADDEPVVSIEATDPSASEAGPDGGTFTVTRTG